MQNVVCIEDRKCRVHEDNPIRVSDRGIDVRCDRRSGPLLISLV